LADDGNDDSDDDDDEDDDDGDDDSKEIPSAYLEHCVVDGSPSHGHVVHVSHKLAVSCLWHFAKCLMFLCRSQQKLTLCQRRLIEKFLLTMAAKCLRTFA
jgi:hypothetical protein